MSNLRAKESENVLMTLRDKDIFPDAQDTIGVSPYTSPQSSHLKRGRRHAGRRPLPLSKAEIERGSVRKIVLKKQRYFYGAKRSRAGVVWKDRPTGKVVLFNEENKIALIGNKVNDFFLLPGGGIEPNESVEDGIKRECLEETGCEIEIQTALGVTEDFRMRDNKHCTSFGYSAKATTYGELTLTDNEADIGAYVKWLSLSKAIELLTLQEEKVKAGEVKFYNTCFNTIRDLLFLRRASDLIQRN